MTIASILRSKGHQVVTARVDAPVHDIIGLLYQHRIGAVLLLDGDRIAGVLSERDIVQCLHQRGVAILDQPASSIMTSDVVTVGPEHSISEALSMMTQGRFRHLPVLENGRLIGIVSIGDLVKRRIEDAEREAEALKDYITTA